MFFQTELNWERLGRANNSYTISHLENPHTYNYGVSVEFLQSDMTRVSSGVVFSRCTYDVSQGENGGVPTGAL